MTYIRVSWDNTNLEVSGLSLFIPIKFTSAIINCILKGMSRNYQKFQDNLKRKKEQIRYDFLLRQHIKFFMQVNIFILKKLLKNRAW